MYRKQADSETIIVLIWLDDFIIAASNNDLPNRFKDTMQSQFKMKDLGKISCFLVMDFDPEGKEIKMSQKRYILKMLEKFGMSDCKPRSTPCELKVEGDSKEDSNNEVLNPKEYKEIVGSLIHAMTCRRPDISWIVT